MTFARMQNVLREEEWAIWVYLIGVLSLTYHFVNGLWTFLITWGITVSPRSQKLSGCLLTGLFFLLSTVWVKILLNFMGWM